MEEMRIKVSTEVLTQRADAAEQKIADVRNRFERIGQIVSQSGNYWEGSANDAHRREYQEYMEEIETALLRFQENVTDLRKISGIYAQTEREQEDISKDLPADLIF